MQGEERGSQHSFPSSGGKSMKAEANSSPGCGAIGQAAAKGHKQGKKVSFIKKCRRFLTDIGISILRDFQN